MEQLIKQVNELVAAEFLTACEYIQVAAMARKALNGYTAKKEG